MSYYGNNFVTISVTEVEHMVEFATKRDMTIDIGPGPEVEIFGEWAPSRRELDVWEVLKAAGFTDDDFTWAAKAGIAQWLAEEAPRINAAIDAAIAVETVMPS